MVQQALVRVNNPDITVSVKTRIHRVHTRQGNVREIFKKFKVRELSGNFILCQGKMNVF